jgi:hypothetical protein
MLRGNDVFHRRKELIMKINFKRYGLFAFTILVFFAFSAFSAVNGFGQTANKTGWGGGNDAGEIATNQAGSGQWIFDAAQYNFKVTTKAPLIAATLTNGSMAANITGWTGANWAYNAANNGEALHTAGTGNTTALTSGSALVAGQSYVITYTVQFGTAGTVTMSAGGLTDSARSASGTYTYYGTASATTAIAFTPTATFDGAVQLVSISAQGPGLTSCGTAPSLQQGSSRVAGNVTMGSGSPTACTVTFAVAFTNTPACTVIPYTASAAAVMPTIVPANTGFTATFSATATAPATSPAAATGFSYACVGLNE